MTEPLKISEDTLVGSRILDYSSLVVDLDTGLYSTLTYDIQYPNSTSVEYLSVEPYSGVLKLSHELDRELEDRFDLWILATDTGGLSCSSKLSVIIQDVNDNPPSFLAHSEAVVSGTYNIDHIVTRVRATDRDSKENRTVTYKLIRSKDASYFSLDPNSGILFLAKPLDLDESVQFMTVEIEASDQGNPQLSTVSELKIRVADGLRDSPMPPTFEQSTYEVEVCESAKEGLLVLSVKALAAHQSEHYPVSYSIVGNQPSNFKINSSNGKMNKIIPYATSDQLSYNTNIEWNYLDYKSKITIFHHVGWPRKTYLIVTTNSYLTDPVGRNLGRKKNLGSRKNEFQE